MLPVLRAKRLMNKAKRKFPNRIGRWLPNDQQHIKQWLDDLIKEVAAKYAKERKTSVTLDAKFQLPRDWLDPLIQEFWDYVDKDPTLHMQYTQMFTEVTESQTPMDTPQVQSYQVMFLLVNYIMLYWAPRYSDYGLVGFPINVILNWSMGTVNGYAAFLHKGANEYWMRVLNKWGEYLKSSKSCYVLNKEPWGWFGEPAQAAMPDFEKEFECDPNAEHYGYKSWDDFFIRKFREGVRPVDSPHDKNVIVSACESLPYDLQTDVQYKDEFWVKEQWYSLRHMLDEDELTSQFVGGTIYQAFLSALNYHRWHSPIDGKIIKARNVPGTYYSATLAVGKDEASPDKSQGYICQVAARAIIFIEADNPAIGLMGFVAIGMSEVSTCEINADLIPKDGPVHVKKGQEIGKFHFGGSTHCLLFRPGVNVEFDQRVLDALYTDPDPENIKLNSKLATVSTK